MTRASYTYVVLRYAHDPASGEALNIGVLLYSPTVSYLDAIFEHTYSRLSAAFAGFDGKAYHRVTSEFGRGIERIRELLTQRGFLEPEFVDATNIALRLWPDRGLSFRFGETLAGVTSDLPGTLRHLFDRFVASQFLRYEYKRRGDEDVWQAIERNFAPRALEYLEPYDIKTRYGPQRFQRTFKNERLHVIEPLSLDYADAGSIIETATAWRGRLDVIRDNSDESNSAFHLIVGPPRPEHQKFAERALQMIGDARLQPQIHREDIDAPTFAEQFSAFILTHVPTVR